MNSSETKESRKLLAANWKMHLTLQEAQKLTSEVVHTFTTEIHAPLNVVLIPPFPYLQAVHHLIKDTKGFSLGAQNLHTEEWGAYTGEVSGGMLASVGVSYCLVGHSERRQYFGEGHKMLAAKLIRAHKANLKPIFCIGETAEERTNGKTFDVLHEQLLEGLFPLVRENLDNTIIAYEPVWAIGTGLTATPEQAQEVHAFIREAVHKRYRKSHAQSIPILYGGSVKGDNAAALFACPDIDGALVGSASLTARSFIEIAKALF